MGRYLVLVAIGLAGCTGTQGERFLGRPGSPAWFATAAPETIAAYFVTRCKTYGFTPGTVEMAQCVQQEAGQTRNRNALKMAVVAANQPKTMNCTSTQFGETVRTTCN